MNTPYLLIVLVIALLAVGAWVWAHRFGSLGAEVIAALLGIVGGMLLFASFLTNGLDTVTTSTDIIVEPGPYHVVVSTRPLDGLPAQTFSDAYLVANAAKIKRVEITTHHNAWGIEMSRSFKPVIE